MLKNRWLAARFWHKIIVLLLLGGINSLNVAQAVQYHCNPIKAVKIQNAIFAYMESNSKGSSTETSIRSQRCRGAYASGIVYYETHPYDNQIVYLQKLKGEWEVLGIATGFNSEFLATIPKDLQQ